MKFTDKQTKIIEKRMKEHEQRKQNRLYLSDEEKKQPITFSATQQQKMLINQLVEVNHSRSISDMINKLLFDSNFRKNFVELPDNVYESIILK